MEAKAAVAVAVDSAMSVTNSTGTNHVVDWSKNHGNQFDSHSNRAGIKKKPKRSIEAAEKLRMISNSEKEENNFSNTSSLSSSSKSDAKDQVKPTPVVARKTRIEEAGVTKKRSSDKSFEDIAGPSSDNGGSGDDCDDEDGMDGDVSDDQYDGDRDTTINGYGSDKDRTYKKSSSNKKSKKSHDDSALRDMANVAARLAQNPNSLSEDAKEAAKREYNRLNAARARVRQKDRLQTLEKDYAKLSELTTRLQRENDILKSQLDVLLQTTNKHQAQAVVSSSASSVQLPLVIPPSTLSHLSAAVSGATGALTPSVRSSSTSSSHFNKTTDKKSTSPVLQNTEQPSVAAVAPSVSSSSPLNMVATASPKAVGVANGSVPTGQLNPQVLPVTTLTAAAPSTTYVPTAASADTTNSNFINSILSTATNLLIQHQQQQQHHQQQQKIQSDLQQQQLQQQLLQTPLSSLQNAAVLEQFLRLSNIQPSQLQQLAPSTSPYMQSFTPHASTNASAPATKPVSTLASSSNHQQSQMINNDTRQLMSSLPGTMTPNNLNLMGWMLQQQQQQQQQQQMGLLNSNGASGASATNPYDQSQSSSSSSNKISGYPFFTTG